MIHYTIYIDNFVLKIETKVTLYAYYFCDYTVIWHWSWFILGFLSPLPMRGHFSLPNGKLLIIFTVKN